MKTSFLLIINSRGSIRTTKNKTTLYMNEISMPVDIELPDSLFEKPILRGEIIIPEDAVTERVITAEIKNNIEDAIQEGSDLKVVLEIIKKEDVK